MTAHHPATRQLGSRERHDERGTKRVKAWKREQVYDEEKEKGREKEKEKKKKKDKEKEREKEKEEGVGEENWWK